MYVHNKIMKKKHINAEKQMNCSEEKKKWEFDLPPTQLCHVTNTLIIIDTEIDKETN